MSEKSKDLVAKFALKVDRETLDDILAYGCEKFADGYAHCQDFNNKLGQIHYKYAKGIG